MDSASHTDTGHASHATIPVYIATYVALMILMGATYLISRFYLGPFNNVAAMGIAVLKATLVVLFFMQVRYGTRLTWVWAALGFIWLSLIFGILGDYLTRAWLAATGWSG
ncbi:MAG TPA: cytochrome C oxidase subunit IV family protein [Chthonomonadaceae bacterium]|nr:cytochrome C oxidase subunit IV family protein [Chthonomonadaceae bacterium]